MDIEGTFAALAKERAEMLDRSDVRRFYDWFANAEPPVPPITGGLGIPGQRPSFSLEGDDILNSGLLPGFGLGLEDDSSGTETPPADAETPSTDTDETPPTDTESPIGEPQ